MGDLLPTLSVYSAMRLLYTIVPTVLGAQIGEFKARRDELEERSDNTDKKKLPEHTTDEYKEATKTFATILRKEFLTWLLQLLLWIVVGFDTFLMKLRVVSASASKYHLSASVLLPVIQLLVQVFGVVQLSVFVRKRLFLFIFGGEDGVMQADEYQRMLTWNALLAKRIYKEFAEQVRTEENEKVGNTLAYAKFIAVMSSFCDQDFQKLVLNENEEKKHRIPNL